MVSMAVENMAAAKGVSSTVLVERCCGGRNDDSRGNVYSKSEVSLFSCAQSVAIWSEECCGNLPRRRRSFLR